MQLLALEVPADARAAARARRELHVIDDLLPAERAADVRLLCSELLTAAVRGLEGRRDTLRLSVGMDRRRVRMEVACPASGPAVTPGLGDGGAYRLALLDALADAWGLGRRRDGTRTGFCEVDLIAPVVRGG